MTNTPTLPAPLRGIVPPMVTPLADRDALDVPGLERVLRSLRLSAQGELIVEDTFTFTQDPLAVEEAFVTWYDVQVSGRIALVTGEKHVLQLTIQEPADATFVLEVLEEESRANRKPIPLKRISCAFEPAQRSAVARVLVKVLSQ